MITSTSNRYVKEIIQLQKKASLRKSRDVYIIEGKKMFSEADPAQIVEAYVSESFLDRQENRALLSDRQIPLETVSDHVMEAMSDTKTPQGVLCVMRQMHYGLEDMLRSESPRLVLLENLQDPGNLGTILRTAEGAGISGVLLNEGCVDIYNSKTIRATMGSLFRVPFLYMEEIGPVLERIRKRGIPIYGAALSDSRSYDALSYKNGCVFMIGNEAKGLSRELLEQGDAAVHIPMEGNVESLNAAVAAAILMYESYRQVRGTR